MMKLNMTMITELNITPCLKKVPL